MYIVKCNRTKQKNVFPSPNVWTGNHKTNVQAEQYYKTKRIGKTMFTAWVKNEYGDLVKQYDDCMNISVLPEHDMELKFPDIIDSIGVRSNYICLVDSSGRHFYPLYVYSVEIG